MTMSASPATSGAISVAMSAPTYWLSASVLTMKSAPSLSARVDARHERGRQALVAAEAHDVMHAMRARDVRRAVARPVVDDQHLDAVDAGNAPRQVARASPGSVAASLRHGIWMISFEGISCLTCATGTSWTSFSMTPSQVIADARA